MAEAASGRRSFPEVMQPCLHQAAVCRTHQKAPHGDATAMMRKSFGGSSWLPLLLEIPPSYDTLGQDFSAHRISILVGITERLPQHPGITLTFAF